MSTENKPEAAETHQPTIKVDELEDIPWVRYAKPTEYDGAHGMLRVVTSCGVLTINEHVDEIQLAGYTVNAITGASDYGLELYVTPVDSE